MHLVSVGVCFVTTVSPAVLLAAEIQPPYFGRARAVAAEKSLLVDPPPEVRNLRSSRSAVFEVPPELHVWDFQSDRIDAGPLLLRPMRTPHTKKPNQPPQHNAGSRPSSDDSPASEAPSAPAPRG